MVTLRCGDVIFHDIQAVIFDKDGTLADSMDFLRQLGQRRSRLLDAQVPGVQEPLLMAFGLERDRISPNGLLAVGTRYENEIAAATYLAENGRDWPEALEIAKSAFQEADQSLKPKAAHTLPFPALRDALQILDNAGLKIGILSSDTTANVEEFAQTHQLYPLIDLCMGTEQTPAKPDPDLFYRACEKLGTSPAKTLSVGDSLMDLKMSRAAGAAGFVALNWDGSTILAAQADAQIHGLQDLTVEA
ncbi:MAG: HAD family hydrolase [Thainema sp.]